MTRSIWREGRPLEVEMYGSCGGCGAVARVGSRSWGLGLPWLLVTGGGGRDEVVDVEDLS
jgi:hypothetical protein